MSAQLGRVFHLSFTKVTVIKHGLSFLSAVFIGVWYLLVPIFMCKTSGIKTDSTVLCENKAATSIYSMRQHGLFN